MVNPRVVNIRDLTLIQPNGDWEWPEDHVYIGRRTTMLPDSIPGGKGWFGNPLSIGKHGTRAQVVALFEEHARARIATSKAYRDRVRGLAGKTLVCWCAPEACHGDALARLADELAAPASGHQQEARG